MPASIPQIHGTIIYPVDGDYGGTWIGVTRSGYIYALLNYYEAQLKIIRNPISRGLLMRELLSERATLEGQSPDALQKFYPFRILKICLHNTVLFTWDGKEIIYTKDGSDWNVYASSFLLGAEGEKTRKESFIQNFSKRIESGFFPDIASEYLSSHFPEKGPKSPCMHRREAHTVSQSVIFVMKNNFSFYYKNGQPCETSDAHILEWKLETLLQADPPR